MRGCASQQSIQDLASDVARGRRVDEHPRRLPQARPARDRAPVGDVAAAIGCLAEDYERIGTHTLNLLARERRTSAIAEAVEAGRRYD